MNKSFATERNDMVERQLIPREIRSPVVLDAMRSVPRHLFVPESFQSSAYYDSPLPIGSEQTISQPYIVAFMTEMLDLSPGMKVLEIGTGSGYQAAVLAYIGCEVYTIERLKEHADRARHMLTGSGYDQVTVIHGNGYLGLPEEAPFDAVIITAAPDSIPPALIGQLKDGGRMIVPVGGVYDVQSLKLIIKNGENCIVNDLLPVRFVPMVNS